MPSIPFPYIPGLTSRAQRELERDFLYVLGLIDAGGVGVFDAIIDPALSQANGEIHEYPNMTSLLANEDWDDTKNFSIGVRGRPGDPILETATMAMPGPFSIRTLGVQGDRWEHGGTGSTDDRAVWDLNGFRMTGAKQGYIEGILIRNTGAALLSGFTTGSIGMVNCILESVDNSNVLKIAEVTSVSNGTVFAQGTAFKGTRFSSGSSTILIDCHYEANGSGSAYTMNSGNLLWQGGTYWGGNTGGAAITITGVSSEWAIIRDIVNPSTAISGGSSAPSPIAFSGSGYAAELEYSGAAGNRLDVTVAAGIDQCSLRGDAFGSITISGNSNAKQRNLDVSASGTVDIADGCNARIMLEGTSAGVILRGSNNLAMISCISATASGRTLLKLIGADNSIATCVGTGAAGSKAYDIDSSCDKSIVVFPGHDVGYTVASVNAGTQCVVIDHTGIAAAVAAADVTVDDSAFTAITGTDVQTVLDDIDDILAGFTAPAAADVTTDTTNFDGVLSGADTNVQLALDTLDDAVAAAGTVSLDLAVFGASLNRFRFLEHFATDIEANGIATAFLEGTFGLTSSATGTGAGTRKAHTADGGNLWGVHQVETGTNTTTTGRAGVGTFDGDTSGGGVFYKNYQKTDVWFLRFVVKTPIVTTVGQTFDVYFGLSTSFGSTAVLPANDFIGFQALADGGNWDALTIDDTTPTTTDTTVGQDTSWHEFIIYQDGTNIKFYIDGVLKATHIIASTNIPDNGTHLQLCALHIQKQTGATERVAYIDLVAGDIPLNIGHSLSTDPLP